MNLPESTHHMMSHLGDLIVRDMESESTSTGQAFGLLVRTFEFAQIGLFGSDYVEAIVVKSLRHFTDPETSLFLARVEAESYPSRPRVGFEVKGPREYWWRYEPRHSLGVGRWVSRHRYVLYEWMLDRALKRGEGFSVHDSICCDMCSWKLPWRASDQRRCINVDHINGVKGDDRVSNLRPLCYSCNSQRNRAEDEFPFAWDDYVLATRFIAPWERIRFDTWFDRDKSEFIDAGVGGIGSVP
jgi:hypothetical protein